MSLSRDQLVFMTKVAEQTERFSDMLHYVKQIPRQGSDLSSEERNLLSVAYKNSVGSRRTAWRTLEAIEQKEESRRGDNILLIREFKQKVKKELDDLCNDVLELIDNSILRHCVSAESKVFFLKMKGDYYRYLAECSAGEQQSEISQGGLQAYQEAMEQSKNELAATNPIRLGLALNFSVFYYEILNNTKEACSLGKAAFDEAIAKIDELTDDEYKDSTTIMQLIRDNLTLWASEGVEGEGDEEGTDNQ